jgi:uncharacterized protein (DUF2461 family)
LLFEDFIQGLIFRFDVIESLGDLAAKDAIFRIHNDMRFAKNKPPYKSHFSAVLAPGGRHSLRLPYYIHIMPGGSLLAGGVHMPTRYERMGPGDTSERAITDDLLEVGPALRDGRPSLNSCY